MPKKQGKGKGKAKGLARAKTRPAGKKAKGRPFQPKAKDADPKKTRPEEEDPNIRKTRPRPGIFPTPELPGVQPRLRPRFIPVRTEKSLLKKSERLAGYASVLAAGMLSNPELIDDLADQDSIASIIETAIFMATQIEQRV